MYKVVIVCITMNLFHFVSLHINFILKYIKILCAHETSRRISNTKPYMIALNGESTILGNASDILGCPSVVRFGIQVFQHE